MNTFGYIAKAIGPHDVLATLLNNLKVQERQLRVCTTIAIAIVAETCSPFTVRFSLRISVWLVMGVNRSMHKNHNFSWVFTVDYGNSKP